MANTKFYVDDDGKYIGAFGDGAEAPDGLHEVANPPSHALDVWNFDTEQYEVSEEHELLEALQELELTDRKIARVGEDVIEILFAKGVLTTDDFTPEALDILNRRKERRDRLK